MVAREDVKRAIQGIRGFHALGQKALQPDGTRRKLTVDEARKLGTSLATWTTTRQFAEDFNRRDLDRLCRSIKTQVGKSGHVFGKSAAILLVRVPVKSRWTFLEAAIRGGWSAHRIKFEIGKKFGTRREGGRLPSLPGDEAGLCSLIEKLAEKWRRLHRRLSSNDTSGKGVSLQDLTTPVRRNLLTVIRDLERLQRAATDRLGELQFGRVPRKPLSDDR